MLYDDDDVAAVQTAAEAAGLTRTGFVAAAGLPPVLSADRQLLADLLQTRTAPSRYADNLEQAVTVLHSGGGAPVWLLQAVAGCARAVDGVDALTVELSRRLAGALRLERKRDRGDVDPASKPVHHRPISAAETDRPLTDAGQAPARPVVELRPARVGRSSGPPAPQPWNRGARSL